ncbi:MAG: FGGY-family carbohydrate kinase [Eubacterium sp.]|nr:FGGY-family carbohydrate kinase [Eubacterium sp.]
MSKEIIENGEAILGVEFGSTRIKALLIDGEHNVIASGDHEWENQYDNGIWTYSLDAIWNGLQDAYRKLTIDAKDKYDAQVTQLKAIGFSAMMHGYMAFDASDELLVPFRTWRNSITGEAAGRLTDLFGFNIPERWSISHLYQAILNGEEHVNRIKFQTTLAGYIHWKLSGEKVLGVGEASGMFPIDPGTCQFDAGMVEKFDVLLEQKSLPYKLLDIFPKVLVAGDKAGTLTEEGAKLLDPTGTLQAGAPMCPPEGDAGTGMTATNSVRRRTGNVSAGTSVFSMVVLEENLKKVHPELDVVTTPDGSAVAMVHCNNCTSDLNAWVGLFKEFADAIGADVDMGQIFGTLYKNALNGDTDGGDILAYNYLSGENITGLSEGRPMVIRTPNSRWNLANFMRVHLYSAFATLKIGNDILFKEEGVEADKIYGHGGIFKTKGVAQQILADALNTPISVMETAGEGGAWGIAVLAAYMMDRSDGESLADYLDNKVFAGETGTELSPDPSGVKGFDVFIEKYKAGLAAQRAAVESVTA